jgi:hypothetical protein
VTSGEGTKRQAAIEATSDALLVPKLVNATKRKGTRATPNTWGQRCGPCQGGEGNEKSKLHRSGLRCGVHIVTDVATCKPIKLVS